MSVRAACAAAGAFAHAGHGLAAADSPLHRLEAEHVLPLLALAASRQQALREALRPLADSLHELKPRRFARAVARGLHLRCAEGEPPPAAEAEAAVDSVD